MIDRICQITGLSKDQLVAVYPYGSRVYGTDREGSDWDFVVVAESEIDNREYRDGDLNIHVYTLLTFQQDLASHKIHALECFFLPPSQKLLEHVRWDFVLDHHALRREFSAKASNSWVKCKKKLTVEVGQEWIGVKSMFHAFRIIHFGVQLGRDGTIADYSAANDVWRDLLVIGQQMETENHWDWAVFNDRFKKPFNTLMSEFRLVAEKEIRP